MTPTDAALSSAVLIHQLRRRYYLVMLGISPIHLVLVSVFLSIVDKLNELPYAVGLNLTLLVLVNLLVARLLFAPIARYPQGQSLQATKRRIHRLPALSALWIACVVLLLSGTGLFGFRVMCPDCNFETLLSFRLTMMILFTSFAAIYAYLAVGDFCAHLRCVLHDEAGLQIVPAQGGVLRKLIAAFVAVAIIPGTLIFMDAFEFGDARSQQGIDMVQAFKFDLVMTLMTGIVAFVFIARSLLTPIRILLRETRRIRDGDLSVRAPVATDDELGELAAGFNVMAEHLEEREFLRETFGKYVPEAVANQILANRGIIEPVSATATILFTDIQNFTAITERLGPAALVFALNEYFSVLVEIVERNGGVVTQFQGDAMLVVYNVPVPDPRHADQALTTALEIQRKLAEKRFGDEVEFITRIGINTGPIIAGSVGAADRLNYTVHGDAVNLAARLQELNKKFKTRILVSATTCNLATRRFPLRPMGAQEIRGFDQPLEVFALDTTHAS